MFNLYCLICIFVIFLLIYRAQAYSGGYDFIMTIRHCAINKHFLKNKNICIGAKVFEQY